jgi:hypothetical protein
LGFVAWIDLPQDCIRTIHQAVCIRCSSQSQRCIQPWTVCSTAGTIRA